MPSKIPYSRPPAPALPVVKAIRRSTEWSRFLNSKVWRTLSKVHLDNSPYCVRCLAKGLWTPALEVHHRKGDDPMYALDESTLEALCKPCHSSETASTTNSTRGKDKDHE